MNYGKWWKNTPEIKIILQINQNGGNLFQFSSSLYSIFFLVSKPKPLLNVTSSSCYLAYKEFLWIAVNLIPFPVITV